MSVFQLFVGIVILFLGIFKPLLYKPVAEKYLPKFSPIFVSFFMRLSAPIVMIFSAIKFKEQTITNQFVFGCLAILFAIPMMFVAR